MKNIQIAVNILKHCDVLIISMIDKYLTYYGAWFVMIFGLSGSDQNSCNRPRDKLSHPSLSQ